MLALYKAQRTDERYQNLYAIGAFCRGESADACPLAGLDVGCLLYFHDVFFQPLHECDDFIALLFGNL